MLFFPANDVHSLTLWGGIEGSAVELCFWDWAEFSRQLAVAPTVEPTTMYGAQGRRSRESQDRRPRERRGAVVKRMEFRATMTILTVQRCGHSRLHRVGKVKKWPGRLVRTLWGWLRCSHNWSSNPHYPCCFCQDQLSSFVWLTLYAFGLIK